MAGVQTSALCIAVSNAGGLGSLPCAMLSAEQLRAELLAIRAGTDQPYNVNFFAHTPPEINAARNLKWKNALAPYYREFGLNIDEFPSGQGRTPFNAESAELLEEFKPPIVSFHFGLPKPELLKRVKAMGAQIISSATTVDEAIWLQANGCDFIIAQGLEAGGHRGHFLNNDLNLQMGTFALLPQVVKAVNVPVIAAGGIADAHHRTVLDQSAMRLQSQRKALQRRHGLDRSDIGMEHRVQQRQALRLIELGHRVVAARHAPDQGRAAPCALIAGGHAARLRPLCGDDAVRDRRAVRQQPPDGDGAGQCHLAHHHGAGGTAGGMRRRR